MRTLMTTVAVLSECVAELHKQKGADPDVKARIEELLEFFQMMTDWYDGVRKLPQSAIRASLRRPRSTGPGSIGWHR